MVGTNWTVEYMGKNADLFKEFDEIIFESVEKIDDVTGTVIRRVAVKSVKNQVSTFFEFKSVQPPLQPKGFADQFVKDLGLQDVTSLDQLKWVFDAIRFDDYIGLEGDPPKTVRNKDGKAIDPMEIFVILPMIGMQQ